MTNHSVELVKRVINSYKEYFKEIPDDRLLAMAVNPVMATKGFGDVVALLDADGAGEKLKLRSVALLEQYVFNILVAEEEAREKDNKKSLKSNSASATSYGSVCALPKTSFSCSERLKQSKVERKQAKQVEGDLKMDLEAT